MKKTIVQPALLLLLVGCRGPHPSATPSASAQSTEIAAASAGGTVDSIFPMPIMIERFQASLPQHPTVLSGAATSSRDELFAKLVTAIAARDADGLRSLRLDASEYGHLYFPGSRWASKPYEQPPAVQWLLTDQASATGERQLLKHWGGQPLSALSHSCTPQRAAAQGEPTSSAGEFWTDCRVIVKNAGRVDTIPVNGTVMKVSGRYKFVSLANKL